VRRRAARASHSTLSSRIYAARKAVGDSGDLQKLISTIARRGLCRKAELEYPSAADVIGKSYKLTPTELRVLLAIVDIGGVPEAAASLGIAESTVKTHLGRLFAETGVGRPADLVKLVAGFSMPLASPHGPADTIEMPRAAATSVDA
jgi:DNA-binding CsgD family transcriptional regulator